MTKVIFRWILMVLLIQEVIAMDSPDSVFDGNEEDEDILLSTIGMVNNILQSDGNLECSVVLVTEPTEEYGIVSKFFSKVAAPSGVSLVMPSVRKDENSTRLEFQHLLQQVKKLRDLSPCVTLIVVSEDDAFLSSFGRASKAIRLLRWSTRVVVVTKLTYLRLRDLLSRFISFSDMNTVAVTLRSVNGSDWCDAYSYLPYGVEGPQLKRLAYWTAKENLIVLDGAEFFPTKYDNLYGTTKWVTAIMIAPYVISHSTTTKEDAEELQVSGREILLLEAVARNMNFTFSFKKCEKVGEMAKNIRKGALVGVMRVAMLPNFLKVVDFTEFIQEATFTFAMAKPTLQPQWQGLYYPLTLTVWACVIFFVVTMPIIMIALTNREHPRAPRSKTWKVQISSVPLKVFGMFLSQGLNSIPGSYSSRILIVFWLLFSFIVGTAYRGNLTAFLTIPKYPPRIDTLEQLAYSKARALFRPKSQSFFQYFKESELFAFKRVSERAYIIPTVTVGLHEALTNEAAYFQERLNMDLQIAHHYPSLKERSRLYIAKEDVMPGYAAWMVPKDAPYLENFNKVIRAARESGLLQKWIDDVMRNEKHKIFLAQQNETSLMTEEAEDGSEGNGNLALTVVHLQGPLILLVLGLAVSTVVFVAEVVVHRCLKSGLLARNY